MKSTHITSVFTSVQSLIYFNNDKTSHHDGIEDGPSSEKKNISIMSGVQQISTGLVTNSDWSFRIYTHLSASLLVAVL